MKAIVVLGLLLKDNGRARKNLLRRLKKAHEVYLKGNYLILSGGMANPKAGITEAEIMEAYCLKKGIEKAAIIKEDKSLDTISNAVNTKKILKKKKIKKILIITSKTHARRAEFIFF